MSAPGTPAGRWPVVAVVGGGDADPRAEQLAEAVGAVVVQRGAALLTGGRGGVMGAASRGAAQARGDARTPPILAVLPGYDRAQANPWADLVLPTGLGHARNALVVAGADVVVVVGGAAGTLSEVGLARKLDRPVLVLAGSGGISDRVPGLLDGIEAVADVAALDRRLAALLDPAG